MTKNMHTCVGFAACFVWLSVFCMVFLILAYSKSAVYFNWMHKKYLQLWLIKICTYKHYTAIINHGDRIQELEVKYPSDAESFLYLPYLEGAFQLAPNIPSSSQLWLRRINDVRCASVVALQHESQLARVVRSKGAGSHLLNTGLRCVRWCKW